MSAPPASAPGVLPAEEIAALIAGGAVTADPPVGLAQMQPASLDLRLGPVAHRVRASFLPGRGRTVAERLAELEMHRFPIAEGAVLERGCVYLVPLLERVALPPDVGASANAKSSTGRLDVLARLISDGSAEFDRLPPGHRGTLWVEVCPRSFSVKVQAGLSLGQIRFRRGEVRLSDAEIGRLHEAEGLVTGGPAVIRDGLAFSVDLAGPGLKGWRAKPHAGVVDLSRVGAYAARDFWDPVLPEQGRTILDPGAFHILKSREAVHVPPTVAAEMAPFLALAGEFRVHYAGFFDPGFGHAASGGAGARGVLEVRCHEAPFVLEHGQVVGRLVFERMAAPPGRLYGAAGSGSSYQGQGLRLSKHFRAEDEPAQ